LVFFETMGIPLILGRDIESRDPHGARKIAVGDSKGTLLMLHHQLGKRGKA
jgi:hypothetical protein